MLLIGVDLCCLSARRCSPPTDDEYQSQENARHVLCALKENARQGFRNGSLLPIGYRVVAAEQRGAKTKKKLEIDLFQRVKVADREVRIMGSHSELLRQLIAAGNGRTAGPVRSSVPKWRRGGDSNPR